MGVGDSWGTREELLHPRDSKGRFRSKWAMSKAAVDRVMGVLGAFVPKTWASDQEAGQYLSGIAAKKKSLPLKDFDQIQADFAENKTTPGTQAFVAAEQELPEDLILSQVVGPEAFGLRPDSLHLMEEYTGKLVANKKLTATKVGTPVPKQAGMIQLSILTPKGTRAVVPGGGSEEVFLTDEQPLRITKVDPDGQGGFYVYAVAMPKGSAGNKRTKKLGSRPPTSTDPDGDGVPGVAPQPAQAVAPAPGEPGAPRVEPVQSQAVGGVPDASSPSGSGTPTPDAAPATPDAGPEEKPSTGAPAEPTGIAVRKAGEPAGEAAEELPEELAQEIQRMAAEILANRIAAKAAKPAPSKATPAPSKATPAPSKAKKAAPETKAEVAVRDSYKSVARFPGDWVPLAELRDDLDKKGLSREEVDEALKSLAVKPKVQLVPWDNKKALTERDQKAAVRFGGEDNNNIRIEADEESSSGAVAPKKSAPKKAAPIPEQEAAEKEANDVARAKKAAIRRESRNLDNPDVQKKIAEDKERTKEANRQRRLQEEEEVDREVNSLAEAAGVPPPPQRDAFLRAIVGLSKVELDRKKQSKAKIAQNLRDLADSDVAGDYSDNLRKIADHIESRPRASKAQPDTPAPENRTPPEPAKKAAPTGAPKGEARRGNQKEVQIGDWLPKQGYDYPGGTVARKKQDPTWTAFYDADGKVIWAGGNASKVNYVRPDSAPPVSEPAGQGGEGGPRAVSLPDNIAEGFQKSTIAQLRDAARKADIKVPAKLIRKPDIIDHIVSELVKREGERRGLVAKKTTPTKAAPAKAAPTRTTVNLDDYLDGIDVSSLNSEQMDSLRALAKRSRTKIMAAAAIQDRADYLRDRDALLGNTGDQSRRQKQIQAMQDIATRLRGRPVKKATAEDSPKVAPTSPVSRTEAEEFELFRDVYDKLRPEANEWISLADFRDGLPEGMSRAEQDRILKRLFLTKSNEGFRLVPNENQSVLTARDRAAALSIGAQDRHLILFAGERKAKGQPSVDKAAPINDRLAEGKGPKTRKVPKSAEPYLVSTAGIEDLVDQVERGIPSSRRKFPGGVFGSMEEVTYPGGRKLLRKQNLARDGVTKDVEVMRRVTDAEQIAARVAQLIGAPTPRVYRNGERTMYQDWVDGDIAAQWMRDQGMESGEKFSLIFGDEGDVGRATKLINSKGAKLLAILDFIVGNHDRKEDNWMVDRDGNVQGIDHGMAWAKPSTIDTSNMDDARFAQFMTRMLTDTPFAGRWILEGGRGPDRRIREQLPWLSKADVRTVRTRLEALRPDFEKLNRERWFDFSLRALQELERRATGTGSLL